MQSLVKPDLSDLMIMTPAKMVRIRLMVHNRYFADVLTALQDAGVVQIETISDSIKNELKQGEATDSKRIGDYAQRFRGLESLLYRMPSDRKYSFESIDGLISAADGIGIDERVSVLRKELDSLAASLKENISRLALLNRIKDFGHDLGILNSGHIVSFVVYGEQLKQFDDAVSKRIPDAIKISLERATIFSIRRGQEKEFSVAGEKQKVTMEVVPQLSGSVDRTLNDLERVRQHLEVMRSNLQAELEHISQKYYTEVSAIREQLDIEMEKLEISTKLGVTSNTVVLEGWMPEENRRSLEHLVANVTKGSYIIETVHTKELPPTKLENPMLFRLYEKFVTFYSLPQSTELDPSLIFALAFPIFFGFMIGDSGYGILILSLALFILHRLSHPPKKSHLPKAITGFITAIVSPTGLRILAKSIIPGAIIAIILGIIFNEWFGFQLPYSSPFAIVSATGSVSGAMVRELLVVSGWMGVIMVVGGYFLGFVNKLANRHLKHAIGKLGWLAAALGIVMLGLDILHSVPLGISNPQVLLSYVLLVAGMLMVVKFEGASAIVELPSLLSHILSYTRLVGILAASLILALVIDLLFTKAIHHGILYGILGVMILIGGQLFNITLAMFEPGIQGARLIYVEFFSKFFTGNGRLFKPFATQRLHTLAKFELSKAPEE